MLSVKEKVRVLLLLSWGLDSLVLPTVVPWNILPMLGPEPLFRQGCPFFSLLTIRYKLVTLIPYHNRPHPHLGLMMELLNFQKIQMLGITKLCIGISKLVHLHPI